MTQEAMKLALEALENWLEFDPENFGEVDKKAIAALREALAEQPTQQEPDSGDNLTIAYMAGVQRGKDLAQRTWVGLTDEEIEKLTVELRDISVTLAFAIEAKLKEKNNG